MIPEQRTLADMFMMREGKSKQELVSMSSCVAVGAAVSTFGCYVEFSVEIPAC